MLRVLLLGVIVVSRRYQGGVRARWIQLASLIVLRVVVRVFVLRPEHLVRCCGTFGLERCGVLRRGWQLE